MLSPRFAMDVISISRAWDKMFSEFREFVLLTCFFCAHVLYVNYSCPGGKAWGGMGGGVFVIMSGKEKFVSNLKQVYMQTV